MSDCVDPSAPQLSLMDTDAGVHQVDDVLTRIEFGVYA